MEAVLFGEDLGEHWQGFFAAILFVAGDENDSFSSTGHIGRRVAWQFQPQRLIGPKWDVGLQGKENQEGEETSESEHHGEVIF